MRNTVEGKVAVVTGAGSGIGRALAVVLSDRGARVVGWDVHAAGLAETATRCGGSVDTAVVDVGDAEAVRAHAAEVVARFGRVNQVYNNAGIACRESVVETDWSEYERVFRVNLNGVIHGTMAFLPHLIASGDGHVINVSSLNGLLAQPYMSHYCTSKFAVRGFTEALRAEMLVAGHPVRVTVVHPGGIATNISDNGLVLAREAGRRVSAATEARTRTYREKLLRMDPAKAAVAIVDGVERGRPRIRVGTDAALVDQLVRLMPATATLVAVSLERRLLASEQGVAGRAVGAV